MTNYPQNHWLNHGWNCRCNPCCAYRSQQEAREKAWDKKIQEEKNKKEIIKKYIEENIKLDLVNKYIKHVLELKKNNKNFCPYNFFWK